MRETIKDFVQDEKFELTVEAVYYDGDHASSVDVLVTDNISEAISTYNSLSKNSLIRYFEQKHPEYLKVLNRSKLRITRIYFTVKTESGRYKRIEEKAGKHTTNTF